MRILITGGRDFADQMLLYMALDRLHHKHIITLVIHGDARGADRLSGKWAVDRGIEVMACPPNWNRCRRGAGPVRNREMLALLPQLIVAFPGGTGTADMVCVARTPGFEVIIATGLVDG